MKRIVAILLGMIVLCCCSCTFGFNQADTITIAEKEYKRAFAGELYPRNALLPREGIRILWNEYCPYPEAPYDCYIAYDRKAEPNVYFEKNVSTKRFPIIAKQKIFNYFCPLDNIHDSSKQQVYGIQNIDDAMFHRLIVFVAENAFNPFSFPEKESERKKSVGSKSERLFGG